MLLTWTTLAASGGVIYKFFCVRVDRSTRLILLLVATWLVLVFGGLQLWVLKSTASQGRLLFPAIAAVAILVVAGIDTLGSSWGGRWWLPMGFLGIAVLSLPLIIYPAYLPPSIVALDEIPSSAKLLKLRYGTEIELLAVDVDAPDLAAGSTVKLTLYWQAHEEISDNYTVFLRILGRDFQPIAAENTYPGWGAWPTSLWRANEIYKDRYQLTIDADAQAPSLARLTVAIGDEQSQVMLPVFNEHSERVDPLAPLANLHLSSAANAIILPRLEYEESSTFGGFARLRGYQFKLEEDSKLLVSLKWETLEQTLEDFTLFLHLLDQSGRRVAGHDGPPLSGFYPTTSWRPGQLFLEERIIALPPDLAPGEYDVAVGWYNSATVERVAVISVNGVELDNALALQGTVYVQPDE